MVVGSGFTVADGAIPEFPTVLSFLAVTVICGPIYRWLRRKAWLLSDCPWAKKQSLVGMSDNQAGHAGRDRRL